MLRRIGLTLLPLCALVLGTSAAQAQTPQVYAYLSAPNLQVYPGASVVPNATIETFNSLATSTTLKNYSSAIGTYTDTLGTFASVASDINGNGTGNYFSFGAQSNSASPVTLTFATAITYFGLAYCAGDVNNGFTFFDNAGNNLGRYSTATLLSFLPINSTVTALNGTTYNTNQYYGQPNGAGPGSANTGGNTSQPYSFVDFFPSSGTTIKTIVFDNSNSTGTGFESDNHTISTDPTITRPTTGAFVAVGSSAAPDAGTLALCLTALPIGLIARRRRAA